LLKKSYNRRNNWKYDERGINVNTSLPDVFLSIQPKFIANHWESLGRTNT